ncbi:response regulator [bacterium]|nr:response regulator [bacterium]
MKDSITKRAIVIEDDNAVRKAISSLLQKRAYEVHEFSEPRFCPIFHNEKCLCAEKHACTNIIITDLYMPNTNGIEFLRKKEINGCKVQNVAVMSAVWQEEELEILRKLGCKILTKPFKLNVLTGWLDECENRENFQQRLSDLDWSPDRS